jgi:hypothetical protein
MKIGDQHQGGIIFYLDESGEHGLIAAKTDIQLKNRFSGEMESAWITHDEALEAILNLEVEGYKDWRLPSRAELKMMLNLKELIGGFNFSIFFTNTAHYWTSEKVNKNDAWGVLAEINGNTYDAQNPIMDSSANVRPIRDF